MAHLEDNAAEKICKCEVHASSEPSPSGRFSQCRRDADLHNPLEQVLVSTNTDRDGGGVGEGGGGGGGGRLFPFSVLVLIVLDRVFCFFLFFFFLFFKKGRCYVVELPNSTHLGQDVLGLSLY